MDGTETGSASAASSCCGPGTCTAGSPAVGCESDSASRNATVVSPVKAISGTCGRAALSKEVRTSADAQEEHQQSMPCLVDTAEQPVHSLTLPTHASGHRTSHSMR